MRLGRIGGRIHVVTEMTACDVSVVSAGRFGPDLRDLLERWSDFRHWSAGVDWSAVEHRRFESTELECPVPAPRQVFAVGLNYHLHASEAAMPLPSEPMVFTKFPTCIAGPNQVLDLVPGDCDWEVELVVVVGVRGHQIKAENAWDHVAGLTIGQDISERAGQLRGQNPQFSLAKSHPGFGPIGPTLVTLDEIDDPNDLSISCRINGITVQDARTSEMIFDVSSIIAHISSVCELQAGDLIFTGTPEGVGLGESPPRFLQPGDVITSEIQNLGTLTTRSATRSGQATEGRR